MSSILDELNEEQRKVAEKIEATCIDTGWSGKRKNTDSYL